MPQGVTGLFGSGAGASAPSYAAGAMSRGRQQDSSDPSKSFDDVLDRASSAVGSTDQASDASKASNKSTGATSKRTAPRHAAAKKKAAASDMAQTKPARTTKNGPAADTGQNASANASSQDADADPTVGDGSPGQEKPEKKDTAAGETVPDASAAVVQLQTAPATTEAANAKPKGGAESAAATNAKPTPAKQASASQDPANAQPATADARVRQPADGPAAPDDGETDPATQSDLSAPHGKARLAIQPKDSTGEAELDPTQVAAAAAAAAAPPQAGRQATDADVTTTDMPTAPDAVASTTATSPAPRNSDKSPEDLLLQALGSAQQPAQPGASHSTANTGTPSDAPPISPTAQFTQANHANVVSGITGRLLPGGGSMQIRLDPPELGAMQVRVEMRDGVMTASFETSTDQATKLLSHSLGDLKTALEAQGVSVERLHVSQTPRQQQSSAGNDQKGDSQPRQDTAAQQEQQRREMMQRMWRRLMKGQDPLDLVA